MKSEAHRFPSIEMLRAFEAVARLGSFERVAAELSITTSAVSKRITALESMLSASLFDRSARTLTLTAAGKEYAEQVRSALAQLASIGLHSRAAQSTPRLRVLTPPTFAREILVPRLKQFTDLHPRVEIEVVVAIPYLDMAVPDADVVVSFGPRFALSRQTASARGNSAGASSEPLLFEPVFAVASPKFARKHRIREPHDVLRVPMIRCPIEPWKPWFEAAGLRANEPTKGVKLVDLGLSLEAAASDQGVCLARASIARRWMERGDVASLFDVKTAVHSGYSLSIARADDLSLVFATWLRELGSALERASTKR